MDGDYRAYLGERHALYYLERFAAFDRRGKGLHAGWNWPALIFPTGWLAYRRMYRLLALSLGLSALTGYLFLGPLGPLFAPIPLFQLVIGGCQLFVDSPQRPVLTGLLGLLPIFLLPLCATSLYHGQVCREIALARARCADEEEVRRHLKARGGVNRPLMWTVHVTTMAVMTGLIAIACLESMLNDRKAFATAKKGRELLASYYRYNRSYPNTLAGYSYLDMNIREKSDFILFYSAKNESLPCEEENCRDYLLEVAHKDGRDVYEASPHGEVNAHDREKYFYSGYE